MADPMSEQMKYGAMQSANMPQQQPLDPNVESMLQSLLIEDPNLMRILKGEIQEAMNKVEETRIRLIQKAEPAFDFFKNLDATDPNKAMGLGDLAAILTRLKELGLVIESVRKEAKRYRRLVPYLLLFTSSSVLSNVTEKQADALWRKVDIMITRDQLDAMDDEENVFEDLNFFEAIRIKSYLHLKRNIEGHTFKGLIEERRKVETTIVDHTQKQKSGLRKLF